MSVKIKDSAIHNDGIYEIDKSCHINIAQASKDDGILFTLLALFVLCK
ncbi:MAG: hypothetical protein Q4F63_05665 [Clostridia bacterium]|nr:hypothetical protein [Clostridia bacterium]